MSAYCEFDNPATWCREQWCDGRVTMFVSAAVLHLRSTPPLRTPWNPGEARGDPAALDSANLDHVKHYSL